MRDVLSGATNFYCYWKDIDIWVVMATMCLCFFSKSTNTNLTCAGRDTQQPLSDFSVL